MGSGPCTGTKHRTGPGAGRSRPTGPCPSSRTASLPPLAELTAYCRVRGIDYLGTPQLRAALDSLQTELPFAARYRLENRLIRSLTLDQVTALEYGTLLYQRSDRLGYSSGRILDVFYSQRWQQLLATPKHLECYLKKSALFCRLGINGACNNYLLKFAAASPAAWRTCGSCRVPIRRYSNKLPLL